MIANEALINEAVVKARPVEGDLRKAIAADLYRAYGPEWRSQLPGSLVTKWSEQHSAEVEHGRDRGPELIEFASLSELIELINSDRQVFEPRFEEIIGEAILEEFRILRNPLMHSRQMSAEDCERTIELATQITVRCHAQMQVEGRPYKKPEDASDPKLEHRLGDERKQFFDLVILEIEGMSGKMLSERLALKEFLLRNKRYLSFPLLEKARIHFAALDDTEQFFNNLSEFVPPRRPPSPTNEWKLAEWLKWAGRVYLPYRRWMIKVSQEDQEIEKFGLEYEDWLHQSYPKILRDGSAQLIVNVYQQIQKLLDSSCSVLWLIIDNLADYWLPKFHDALQEAGFTLERHQRMLTMLPSVTEISRRSMCAGRLPKDARGAYSDDAAAFYELWELEDVRNPRFCRTIIEARSAVVEGSQLIALIFNRLDQRAHRADDGWFSAEEDIELNLNRMFEKIGELIKAMHSLRPTKLVITTDHGCIKPPEWSEVLNLPSSAKPTGDVTYHKRYTIIKDATGLNPIDWHVLDADSFQLPHNYAVSRGQRFIGGRPRGYTHGGLSPEETVVQYFEATPGTRENEQLTFFYSGDPIRLGQESEVGIIIVNPFVFDVEQVIVRIPHMDVEFAPLDIPALSQITTKPHLVLIPKEVDIHRDRIYLPLICEYSIAGSHNSLSTELKIDVLTLYSSDIDDFEGLFDD